MHRFELLAASATPRGYLSPANCQFISNDLAVGIGKLNSRRTRRRTVGGERDRGRIRTYCFERREFELCVSSSIKRLTSIVFENLVNDLRYRVFTQVIKFLREWNTVAVLRDSQ